MLKNLISASYECRMNEQWSCAGICVKPQSEQRSLGTNQQATAETHNLSGINRTTPAASLSTARTPTNFPNCSSSSSSSLSDCITGATSHSLAVDGRALISCSTVSLNKVEEQNSSCSYEASSSVPTDDILLSSGSRTLTDETYPSTSTVDTNIFDEKTTLQDCQLSRIIRRRCRFLLPSYISHKLLRIALKQPATLKHLNITSVKVGESDLLPVIANDATLSLLSLPYSSTSSEMNSLADVPVPVGTNATDRARVYDPYQRHWKCAQPLYVELYRENSRHELTPSTSAGHASGKRKADIISNDMYQTAIGVHGYVGATTGQSSATTVAASVKQQQSQTSNTSSPLLVNLLRSSSPVANAGMHNLQHTHMSRPSAAPVMQHMSAPSPQTQGTAGYSSYPYMGQSTMNAAVQPGRMRPSATPTEASHLTTSTLGHSEQQQMRPAPQEVSMERHQQIVASQQQSAPAQQLPQTYYPQYSQRRPMIAGFAVRGQMPQQQSSIYAHQQGQMMPPHYIHVQQQPRLPGQPIPVHFHQTVSLEQKRKRPTKKQLKEAEIAQQTAAAAAAQQQFMMEQQMNSRVPSANAHTVDRPTIMSQVMQSGQPNVGITYAQHPQGYPAQTLRSPPTLSAQTGPMMQNPSSNPSFYQQQNVWVPQHQQQIMPQQRPQMVYGGQMQHHWQNNQSHHSRMMYPQADNVSEMSTGSSGSVHTSPITSRNASIDYSPASQSSSTMSPLYHQQQPSMVYQQPSNQQTPSSGLTYPQPSSSQQQIPARPQQQAMPMQMQEPQQQQPSQFSAEQHCLDIQPKSCLPVLQSGGDFEMDDELGANIADDCGDYNDLDSIEPMTESSDFGATLMASHQQQMQQRPANTQQHMQEQQQHQYYSRMLPPQNRYDVQSSMQQQNIGYMRQMCNETQMRQTQCGFPGALGLSQQQHQSLSQGYSSPQQQQQQPSQGTTNLFMSPSAQPNCSPSPYTPRSSPQKDGNSFTARQQQPRHIAVAHQQYAASPLSQQQQQPIRTPLSAPPTVHSQSQLHPTCGRIDDLRSSRSGCLLIIHSFCICSYYHYF
ncbi:unnamed protein product [Onchocerca flexuosa]|uniref:SP-RING-type domain-containing protein n=1 Tax=Onchocerca flexuosa TaxID=387005 RepID=A0A183I1C7_9BILA|nr:unnamed protein product [Onchocerca flexuosa]